MQAASLSGWDQLFLAGRMSDHLQHIFPVTLGRDFAGVVVKTGAGVTQFAVGDPVVGLVEGGVLHEGDRRVRGRQR